MRTPVIVAYCDGEHDEQVLATTERTEFGVLLDLCWECSVTFDQDVKTMWGWLDGGVPAKRARKSPSQPSPRKLPDSAELRTCPDCGYVCPTRTALGQHAKKKHGTRLGDYDWPNIA